MKANRQGNGVASTDNNRGQKSSPSSGNENRMLLVLFISLVLDLLSFTLILPLLPSLLDYYGEHDKVKLVFIIYVCESKGQNSVINWLFLYWPWYRFKISSIGLRA